MDEVFDILRKLMAREVLGETDDGVGKEALLKSKEIGVLVFFVGPPDKEKAPAASLHLHRAESGGGVMAVNDRDRLVYLLRDPDARDLLKILER